MPLPVGVSVAMMKRSNAPSCVGEPRAQQRGAQVAGGADLQRDLGLPDDALEVRVRHRGRAAIDVERDVRMHLQQMIAGDRAGARDRRAAGVAGGDQPGRLRVRHHRHIVVSGLHRAEAGFGQPHALLRQLAEVRRLQAGLQDHRAGDDLHAARAIVRKAALCRDRQRLDAFDVARPPRHVHLARRDRRRGAAVQVAFQIADGALARRVVAERDVHVAVDQARESPSCRRHRSPRRRSRPRRPMRCRPRRCARPR